MKVVSKTHVENSKFMEFIDEMATQITEMNFGYDTWVEDNNGMSFSEEAQDYYNDKWSEYEAMANSIMGVHSDNELKQ